MRLRRMRRFRVVFVLLLIVAAGLGAAAAASVFAGPPPAARGPIETAHAVPQDHPTSALMRNVLIGGEPGSITPAVHQTSPVGSDAARRLALAAGPEQGRGTRVLGEGLAYVTESGLGQHRLMWLVSVNLPGGLTNPGGPDNAVLKPDNFIVAFIDAKTGGWAVTSAGYSASLPPLPVIRG